jgi:hypothetical protein
MDSYEGTGVGSAWRSVLAGIATGTVICMIVYVIVQLTNG